MVKQKLSVRRTGADHERLLALDTSSTCVGWAVFEDGSLVQHGRYRQKQVEHGERLATFQTWLEDMLRTFNPNQLVYEKPFAGRRRNAFGVLTMYVAVVLLTWFRHSGLEITTANAVPARDVKRRNSMRKGKDHEQNKKLGVLLANRLYGLRLKYKSNDKTKKVSQDDEADAILLGRAWLVAERPWLVATSEK